MAGIVTPDEARQKIANVMGARRAGALYQNPAALRLVSTNHYLVTESTTAPCCYVFNVGDDKGYIVAGADDRIPAVLGYSLKGQYDPTDIPLNMQAWLQSYSDQMAYLNNHPEAAAPRRTVSGKAISPLLTCHWDQIAPYNNSCPVDGDERSLTGCVATAMAQVMYFWQYPNYSTTEIPGYTTEKRKIKMPAIAAGTLIDWSNILPEYNGSETEAQQQAVANLMLLCGTSVQMNYTSDFSGAWGGYVAQSLLSYFDYDVATVYESHRVYRAAEWNQKVYDELKAGRPVYYDGSSSGSGHAFVIDGYGGDDYFHVNWGWGGSSDDYFLLSILDPHNNTGSGATSSADGYSFDQGAVFGAQPKTGVQPTITPILSTNAAVALDGTQFTRNSVNEDFTFRVGFTHYNDMNSEYTFDWGVAYYDPNTLSWYVPKGYYSTLAPEYGFFDPSKAPFTFSLGKGVTNGTYIIKPVSRERGSTTWLFDKGSDFYFITAVVKGNNLTLIPPTFGLTGQMKVEGKKEVGVPLSITATINNQGTPYLGEIFLCVNDKVVAGRHFDSDAGASTDVTFMYSPTASGDTKITLCTREWGNNEYVYTPFITTTVTVAPAPYASLEISPLTKNAELVNGQYILKKNKAVISLKVSNKGTTDYDNYVIVKLFKLFNDNTGSLTATLREPIQLAAGATKTVELETPTLINGASYFYLSQFMSEGEAVNGCPHTPVFTVQYDGSGIRNMFDEPSSSVIIYDMNGVKLSESGADNVQQTLQSLPKGAYVVRSGQQVKVVRN